MYRFKRDFGGQKLKDPPSGHLGAKPSLNLKMYPIYQSSKKENTVFFNLLLYINHLA